MKTDEFHQRLTANEQLVQQLLVRMELWESRDRQQQEKISALEEQLKAERRTTASLKKTVRKLASRVSRYDEERSETKKINDMNAVVSDKSLGKMKEKRYQDSERNHKVRQVENKTTVAFLATISTHANHVGANQILVFDHVITNVGNSYNNHGGLFVAPLNGVYVFSATIMSLYHTNGHFYFTRNGQALTTMYMSGGEAGYDTTSQTVVLQLRKGDDVSIHNVDADVSLAGQHFSSFAGFLLHEDFSEAQVVIGK